MPQAMTSKERWLAALHLQPVDRLPFWPKIDGSYARAQKAPFSQMALEALHEWMGSDVHTFLPSFAAEHRTGTSVGRERDNGRMRTAYTTPAGTLEGVDIFDEGSQAWHPVEFPVRTVDDVRLMADVYRDVTVELDREALARTRARHEATGQEGLTAVAIGKSPLMQFVELYAGVEGAHYLLADHRDEVEALFDAMHRVLCEKAGLLAEHSPADVLYMIENTSTTLISPDQFRRYCHRHLRDYARICSDAGRDLVLHMCGHLKVLLPDLAQLPVRAFEAFTSPTVGNTSLHDGRTDCPDKCLIGGTNASLWTRPADAIAQQLEADLGELPHHRGIVVTSAGVMPPLAAPETIRAVRDWVATYPARM